MTTKTDETSAPTNVVDALARVMGDLGGIGKMTQAERQRRGIATDGSGGVSYAYRGIDQISAAVQPLLAKYGVVIIPKATESKVIDIVVNSKPWTDTTIRIEWTIAGPGGTMLEACSEGQGRDNSDKGLNKAFTSAYKNLLIRMLCIGDPDDDPDNQRVEAELPPPVYPKKVEKLWERLMKAKGTPYADAVKAEAEKNNTAVTRNALTEDEHWYELVVAIVDDKTIGQQEEKTDG